VWSYELGTKNTLLDRRLQLQASAYYISWTKIQQNVGLPDCGEAFIDNLGAAVSKGFDLQVAAQVTDNLKLGGFAGYTDAYYPNTVFGAAAPLENAGDHLAGVLPWTYAVNAEYRGKIINIWSGSEDYLRADFRWLGRPPAGDPTLPNYIAFLDLHRDPAYSLLNLRAGITKDRWDISLFINNATNSNPLISIDNSANGNLYSALRIQPRTVGITAYYRF
jgi:outer membrane receptor protein involved in Fe transport